jgi:hypothetical protein
MEKMHLWDDILPLLDHQQPVSLRSDALRLVALASKNNEETARYLVQEKHLAHLLIDDLTSLIEASDAAEMLVKRYLMALSSLMIIPDAHFDSFMDCRSQDFFAALQSRFIGMHDQICFFLLNYCWSRGKLPACFDNKNTPLYQELESLHCDHCDDEECRLPWKHRLRP